MADLMQTVGTLRRHGVGFKSLHEAPDTTTPGGRLVFHVFAALAEFIREVIGYGPGKLWSPTGSSRPGTSGEAPRDRRRERLPGSTLSRSVPARLTCQALADRSGPGDGHIPYHARGPLPGGKGP